jgi:uncharacterized protein YukE
MRVGASRIQLYDAQKVARAHWDVLQSTWDDAARRDFDESTWQPLDKHVSELLRAIDHLSVMFTQIRNECEPPT